MAIGPKHSFTKKFNREIAQKTFTDREEPRKSFWKHVNKVREIQKKGLEEFDVLTYYGVGGIGKSSLKKKIIDEIIEDIPNALIMNIDFSNRVCTEPARGLLELVKSQYGQKKFTFPHFEVAYTIYFLKRNPDITYSEKSLPFESEFGVIADLISNFAGMGIIGSATGIVTQAYKVVKKVGLNKGIKASLKELESLTVQEIEERLPAFFAYDLKEIHKKNNPEITCILLDTFEALYSDATNNLRKSTCDDWIRELIVNLDGVLFVVCSREKLNWEEIDSDWKTILDQHLLGELDTVNATKFLVDCGIQNEDIVNKIINASEGHPYYLDLAVDTFFELKNQKVKIKPELFGGSKKEVLARFIKYLDLTEIETLKLMAIPQFYNFEIFELLVNTINTGYPVSAFNNFNTYSFISEQNKQFYIHGLMREEIKDYLDYNIALRVHNTLFEFYDKKLTSMDYMNSSMIKTNLIQAIYHALRYMKSDNFIEWYNSRCFILIKKMQLNGEARYLYSIMMDIYLTLDDITERLDILNIIVDIVHLNGDYKRAVDIAEYLLKRFRIEEITQNREIFFLKIRSVHHRMFYEPVDNLICELKELYHNSKNTSYKRELNELLFMIGGNLGMLSGDFEDARVWLNKSIKLSEEYLFNDYYIRGLRKKIDLLRVKGDVLKAEKLCKEAIIICNSNDYDRYKLYLEVTLADVMRQNKKYDAAKQIINKLEKSIKTFGIKGWEGHLFLAKANLFLDLNELEQCFDCLIQAKHIYKKINQVWGEINAGILTQRYQYYDGYEKTNDKNEIIRLKNLAEKYNYRYEFNLLESILNIS